ncbi:unnamed protein product [Mytilus coruscus]|uniref:Uncharacterized protein n=1 Tax=Mytilus coruscus TaxID=42192 RepID=A0A6J8ALQ1_MYTCO|nr:unnamed protein product [Mytilus coruscus]
MLLIWIEVLIIIGHVGSSPFGPVYPITAAVFRNRYSGVEWNETLDRFKNVGGDTIIFRAPALEVRTKSSLDNDPDYASCGSSFGESSCYDTATKDLTGKGLNVTAVVTYSNDENYGTSILSCPEYDKRLNSATNKLYHRIVLPLLPVSGNCSFPKGSKVIVLLSVFSGGDPHEVLLKSAASRNFSVLLGLPAKPQKTSISVLNLIPAYLAWTERVLEDHKTRYSPSIYKTILGYYSRDEILLSEIELPLIQFYKLIASSVHGFGKKILISANIDLSRLTQNKTVADHVQGFSKLSARKSANIDFIAVHEGRGYGRGGLYWPTQVNQPINASDPKLMHILQRRHLMISPNVTFGEVFTGSVQELFQSIRNYRNHNKNTSDLWLLLEAEEDLIDDVCLPVDTKASGNSDPIDRTSKSRIDRSLSATGAAVQKVMAFAYDPEFTCTTKSQTAPLVEEISTDSGRPIISNCSFHSSANKSVVVIGYNLEGETQGFQVDWPDRDGKQHQDHVNGYYFELDYGEQHGLIPSLEYTQLYDPYDVISLADHGYVKVQAIGSYHGCSFVFDYRQNRLSDNDT